MTNVEMTLHDLNLWRDIAKKNEWPGSELIAQNAIRVISELNAKVDAYYEEIRVALGMSVQEITEKYELESKPVEVERIDNGDDSITFKYREYFRLIPRHRKILVEGEIEVCAGCRNSDGYPVNWPEAHPS